MLSYISDNTKRLWWYNWNMHGHVLIEMCGVLHVLFCVPTYQAHRQNRFCNGKASRAICKNEQQSETDNRILLRRQAAKAPCCYMSLETLFHRMVLLTSLSRRKSLHDWDLRAEKQASRRFPNPYQVCSTRSLLNLKIFTYWSHVIYTASIMYYYYYYYYYN